MNRMIKRYATTIMAVLLWGTFSVHAASYMTSNVGANGYDVVSYFEQSKAVRGTGWHTAVHKGTTYLFATKKNRKAFVKAPEKYLPEFGGYCAFGAAVGKKFYADPTVWKIVDGKLYLNLDNEIQKKWEGDLTENLRKGYANWSQIQDANPEGI